MATIATLDHATLLEATWAAFRAQVVAGNQHLVLPDNLPSTVVSEIATRYGELAHVSVSIVPVPSLHIIRFTPYVGETPVVASPAMSSSVASPESISDSPTPKGKSKIPRPPNAFILYRQAWHPIIKKQNPGIANNDISKQVAALWKSEDEEGKATWKARAEAAKQEHLQKHPGYSYQPRKSSEKKRRMTKAKAAALQAQSSGQLLGDGGQLPVIPQLPLPDFVLSQDSATKQFTFNHHQDGIEHFTQLIDEHNSTQGPVCYNRDSTVIGSEELGFASGDFSFPQALMGFGGSGFPPNNSNYGVEPLLTAGTGNAFAEQERHDSMGEDVFDFDAFFGHQSV